MVTLVVAVTLALIAGTCALDKVQYGEFVPAATFSVANQLGFFTSNGLDIVNTQVPSSTVAFELLLNGTIDILTATVDNALNFRFNQNQNVTVVGQLDQGPDLVFASIPSITNISQLEGKPIMVDSPLSGYAFLLRFVLSKFGLLLDRDYSFMTIGGTDTRFADLIAGTTSNGSAAFATILTYPVTIEGEFLPSDEAPNILARVSDFIAPITSSTFIVQEAFISDETKSSLLTRFLTSMLAANLFLLNPANSACSIAAIAADLGVTTAIATEEYESAINAVSGEVSGSNFTVNQEGIMNDVVVRQMFDGFTGVPSDFNFTEALIPGTGKLIDNSLRDAAVALLQSNPLVGNCSASA